MEPEVWNRCDVCGRFIAFEDFDKKAVRRMVMPDSELSMERYETLCGRHADSATGDEDAGNNKGTR